MSRNFARRKVETVSKAVVLLSGGLDSATMLAIARYEGFEPCAITFRYGQRHAVEIEAARRLVKTMNIAEHLEVEFDLRAMGGSALTSSIAVPKGRSAEEMQDGIPVTYVPARNTIFLSFALGYAESLKANHIFVGVNALDYSGYPDCRPEYIRAFETMARLATKSGVESDEPLTLHTPLIEMTKSQIIKRGLQLNVDYSLTCSCYDPDGTGRACGHCDACSLRLEGFRENGIADPVAYQE
ncbi:MAG: 7-cyano-7-deazaguanine synthase QueC [Planctomycetales bacterium]